MGGGNLQMTFKILPLAGIKKPSITLGFLTFIRLGFIQPFIT